VPHQGWQRPVRLASLLRVHLKCTNMGRISLGEVEAILLRNAGRARRGRSSRDRSSVCPFCETGQLAVSIDRTRKLVCQSYLSN